MLGLWQSPALSWEVSSLLGATLCPEWQKYGTVPHPNPGGNEGAIQRQFAEDGMGWGWWSFLPPRASDSWELIQSWKNATCNQANECACHLPGHTHTEALRARPAWPRPNHAGLRGHAIPAVTVPTAKRGPLGAARGMSPQSVWSCSPLLCFWFSWVMRSDFPSDLERLLSCLL